MTRLANALRAGAAAVSSRAGYPAAAVALACALTAVAGTIGADLRWLPALGRAIVDRGGIPDGVPFATAPSAGWPNVPVLAELVLDGIRSALGDRGFLLAQLLGVGGGLSFLVADMRRAGASELGAALAVILIVVGALPVLVVIRLQLFSLLLFPALVALLRADARKPSRGIWLLPPLLALWSNLHGAVLVGLAVAGAYLVLERAPSRTLTGVGVLLASALAVCATPAREQTPSYYLGIVRNEAARRGEGLWAPLSLHSVFDLLLIAVGIVLIALCLRARPALWEAVVLAGLIVLTIRTARSGVWLLFFAAPVAARGLRLGAGRRRPLLVAAAASILVVFGLARGPLPSGAGGSLLDDALRRANGTAILADAIVAEQVALAGGRVWMSNPLDAFPRADQRLYLDWLGDRPAGRKALAFAPRVVLVGRHTKAARLVAHAAGWHRVAADDQAILYVRRVSRNGASSGPAPP